MDSPISQLPAVVEVAPEALVPLVQGGVTSKIKVSDLLKGSEYYDAINDFGCDNTGATNTTTALLNFYNACIASGKRGRIRAGTYKVTTGVLVFDTGGGVDKPWPHIETDGYNAVNFQIDSATETNAPVLTWKNGVATSGAGRYWKGGSHGGITVIGSGTSAAGFSGQHHFSFTGMWGTKFGWMCSQSCKGNSFDVPQALYAGNNPDPYAASFLSFDCLESNNAVGFGFHNANWVGMDSWTVQNVRIIGYGLGAWFGMGSGNIVNNWSVASGTGWAYDDGCQTSNLGGSPQRNYIEIAEFDNVQYGIRLNNTSRTKFIGIRFVHRFQTTPNVAANYWPRTCIDVCGGAGAANVNNVDIDVLHRLEAGGVLANLGVFLDGHNNGNLTGFNVLLDYADNGPLGVTDSNFLMANRNASTTYTQTRKTKIIEDQTDKGMSVARGSAATSVPNNGFATVASKILFPTQLYNPYTPCYDTGTSVFTAPHKGVYLARVTLPLALPVGTRVRIGFFTSGSGSVECSSYLYSVNAGLQMYAASGHLVMNAGDTLYVCADQTTAGAVNCAPNFNANEVQFVVTPL